MEHIDASCGLIANTCSHTSQERRLHLLATCAPDWPTRVYSICFLHVVQIGRPTRPQIIGLKEFKLDSTMIEKCWFLIGLIILILFN
jgi:hypothetical protein